MMAVQMAGAALFALIGLLAVALTLFLMVLALAHVRRAMRESFR